MAIKENKEMFKWNGRLTGYVEQTELLKTVEYEKKNTYRLNDYQKLMLKTRDKYMVQTVAETERVFHLIRELYDERTCRMMRERYMYDRTRKEMAAVSYLTLRQQGYLEKKILARVFGKIAEEEGKKAKEKDNGLL